MIALTDDLREEIESLFMTRQELQSARSARERRVREAEKELAELRKHLGYDTAERRPVAERAVRFDTETR